MSTEQKDYRSCKQSKRIKSIIKAKGVQYQVNKDEERADRRAQTWQTNHLRRGRAGVRAQALVRPRCPHASVPTALTPLPSRILSSTRRRQDSVLSRTHQSSIVVKHALRATCMHACCKHACVLASMHASLQACTQQGTKQQKHAVACALQHSCTALLPQSAASVCYLSRA